MQLAFETWNKHEYHLPFTQHAYAPINVNPTGGGGSAGNGGRFDGEIHPSVGGLIEYLCSGVGAFAFFQKRDWDQVSARLHSVFDLFWQRHGVWGKVFYHNFEV